MSSVTSVMLGDTAVIELTAPDVGGVIGFQMRIKHREYPTEYTVPVTVSGSTVTGTYVPTQSGYYDWRAWRSSDPRSAIEGSFFVAPSSLAPDP